MDDKTGDKTFKYRQILTKIAHREQISFEIDLDDVQSFDEELAMSIANNTRRYTNLVLNVCLYKNANIEDLMQENLHSLCKLLIA